jgi:hypothetical protein
MAKHTITLTDKQEQILAKMALKTGRTVDELIQNFLEGWVGQLEPQALVSQVEEEFSKLSDAEKIEVLQILKERTSPSPVPPSMPPTPPSIG